MASEVNLRILSVEDFSLLRVVTTGTLGTPPDDCAATFASRVSPQTAPNSSTGSTPPGRLPRPDDGDALRAAPSKLTRARRRPLKTARSRSGERPQFVPSSTAGQSSGALFRPSLPFSVPRAEAVSGANPNDKVGNGDAARSSGITSHKVRPRRLRSSLAASVRSPSSPTRLASLLQGSGMVVSFRGTSRPRRRYRSSTAS
jgi:hypothetical protein